MPRVLVVEDDETFARYMRHGPEGDSPGYCVPEEFVRALKRLRREPPHLKRVLRRAGKRIYTRRDGRS